jgi:hypothetical protein
MLPKPIEIIDVDAIDPQLDAGTPGLDKSKHKQGMSSVDSTVRIEQTLYSALGPEYSTFESRVDAPDLATQLAQSLRETTPVNTLLNPTASAFEPSGKRKRSVVGDESGSPVSKREKGGVEVEEVEGEDEDML